MLAVEEKALRLKMKRSMSELYRFSFKLSLLHKLIGLDFSRCFEYSCCLHKSNLKDGDRVLDVGSLQACFPLYLVKKGVRVITIDIDERVLSQRKYARNLGITTNDDRFDVVVGDATKLDFPEHYFDAVTCISTIEHIPGNGDIEAIKEFSRILKPGGRCFISVPYSQEYQEGTWGRWFQRNYDYEALETRLIRPSDLSLKEIGFFVDRKTRRYTDWVYFKVPRLVRFATQWSQILFARYFAEKDEADKNDAWISWLLLEKQ